MRPGPRFTVRHQIVMLVACIAAFATTSYTRAVRMPRGVPAFAVDAMGLEPAEAGTWSVTLRSNGAAPVGLISAAAVCGDEVFLLDSRQSLVHRFDLPTGRQTGQVGASGTGPDEPRKPRAMALDCAGRTLYLIDLTRVFVYDLASGRNVRRFEHPANFVSAGGTALLDKATDTLFVPGLWPAARHDWLRKGIDSMFDGDRLGYRLSLRDGTTTPLFTPIERGCWAYSADCLNIVFDKLPGVGPGENKDAWVVAQSVSTQVGIFDANYRMRRVFDIRSPRFHEDGARTTRSNSVIDEMRWHEDNSVIRRVYAFDDGIVTIHTTNAMKGWTPGKSIPFNVHINVHALDGSGLVSDVRLPDLPVGRDDKNLYVIDYGTAGRRLGAEKITLLRYPIVVERDALGLH